MRTNVRRKRIFCSMRERGILIVNLFIQTDGIIAPMDIVLGVPFLVVVQTIIGVCLNPRIQNVYGPFVVEKQVTCLHRTCAVIDIFI